MAQVRTFLPKLATLVNSAWGFGVDVAWKAARGTELGDEIVESLLVPTIFWIEPSQRPFKPYRGKNRGSPMARPNNVDEVEIVLRHEDIEMGIDQRQTWTSAPMP